MNKLAIGLVGVAVGLGVGATDRAMTARELTDAVEKLEARVAVLEKTAAQPRQAAAQKGDANPDDAYFRPKVKYDRFNELTTVQLCLRSRFEDHPPGSASICMLAVVETWERARNITVFSPSMKGNAIVFLADGKRIMPQRGEREEYSVQDVEIIANARNAEVRVGSQEFALPDEDKKMIREFLDTLSTAISSAGK